MNLLLLLLVALAGAPDADPRTPFSDDVARIQARVPAGFTVIPVRPFVVIGNESPPVVARRASGTVAWAADKLKQDFFRQDPPFTLQVWLLADGATYQRYAREIAGYEPDTPYGFWSAEHRALIMNISTGGGTLVHELVHPYMDHDFPSHPAWVNEGMGSLFEQSAERDGHIVGLTNWRLGGLQDAIRAGSVPPFATVMAMDDATFYGEGSGTHYALSRYLLLYVQEKGLLPAFYRRYRDGAAADPTGVATLQAVLGEPDLAAFQTRWEAWVLGLRFGG